VKLWALLSINFVAQLLDSIKLQYCFGLYEQRVSESFSIFLITFSLVLGYTNLFCALLQCSTRMWNSGIVQLTLALLTYRGDEFTCAARIVNDTYNELSHDEYVFHPIIVKKHNWTLSHYQLKREVTENNDVRAVIIPELSHHAYCTIPYRD